MKTALVLEGGGLRGVYTEGVLDALMQAGWRADYVVGVSAGANNGIYYVTGQMGDAVHSILAYVGDDRYVSVKNFIRTRSFFGMDFIFDEIPKELVPLDFEAVARSDCQYEAVATDVETGEAAYFGKEHLAGHDTTVLRASCSLPMLSPMVPYQGRLYLDGGVADPIPVRRAMAMGCERAVIVRTRPRDYVKSPERPLYRPVFRGYPAMIRAMERRHEVYNASARLCNELEEAGQAVVIAPQAPLALARFEKDPDKLNAAYHQGLADGRAALSRIEAFTGRP